MRFLSSYFRYVSRQADIFTLSPADDLMELLAGGRTKYLDLPGDAGAAGEQRKKAYD
jgi:hypothetical protein